ncbi:MAG: beta-ketoacyl-ACP synthase I, partial [Gammaproteobacteria bacterium]|nr:beta-ketoacyl-ACP synthase I [Gammaproteobacteria bacterium]
APSGEGAMRCMRMAIKNTKGPVDYINAHATSTPVGDVQEVNAIREVFGTKQPLISSTKSLTGHAQGAAGAHEAIYSILMLNQEFICKSANIESLDSTISDANIALETIFNTNINTVLSNSFGFGGTNAALAFSRL